MIAGFPETAAPEERIIPGVDLADVLSALVSGFSSSPVACAERMRKLLHLDPDAFRAATIALLHHPVDMRGCRYLVTLLWTHSLLIPLLSDTSIPLAVALGLTSTAAKLDPRLSTRLTRYISDSMLDAQNLHEATGCRLLELLGSIADAAVLQPFLRQILLHPSARVRSKAGLLIGHDPSGVRMLEKLLADDNERVRANATEALWGGDAQQASPIFVRLLKDVHHRVVGNAALGLYRLGDLRAFAAIQAMGARPEPLFQAAGIWVMGRTKDPRYLTQLGRMLASSSGPSRQTIFHALTFCKKAATERAANPPLKVTALRAVKKEGGAVAVDVYIEGEKMSEPPCVHPTGFALTDDGEPVSPSECRESRPDSIAISFVVPCRGPHVHESSAGMEAAILKALDNKGKKELWSIARYTPNAVSRSMAAADSAAPATGKESVSYASAYTANPIVLRTDLGNSGASIPSSVRWLGAVSRALTENLPARESRHLITFIDSTLEVDTAGIEHLREQAAVNGFALHILSREHDTRIFSVCSQTGGNACSVASDDEMEPRLLFLYSALKRFFAVTYQRPGDAEGLPRRIGIQVHNETRLGEAEWLKSE